ncbi:MAG: lysophospholipase [Halorubrum sp. J07HR59]|nr:MAG: lysophospholipase [Halorubrum sp. J07HR59]
MQSPVQPFCARRKDNRPSRERYATRTVTFPSGSRSCRGDLYLPEGHRDPPAIVMGPGIGACRRFGYSAVAERFAEAGYAVLLFDYRGFGASDGGSGLVDPHQQQTDYAAAVDHLAERTEIGDRVALWGWSLGGGHALAVAAERDDIDAVVSVAPITDGRTLVRRRPRIAQGRAVLSGMRDAVGHRVGLGQELPIVSDTSRAAVLPDPDAKRAYLDLVDADSSWHNAVPARSLLQLARYRPAERLDAVETPVCLLAGRADQLVPVDTLDDVAERLPEPTQIKTPATHFSPLGDDLDSAIGYAVTFLAEAIE